MAETRHIAIFYAAGAALVSCASYDARHGAEPGILRSPSLSSGRWPGPDRPRMWRPSAASKDMDAATLGYRLAGRARAKRAATAQDDGQPSLGPAGYHTGRYFDRRARFNASKQLALGRPRDAAPYIDASRWPHKDQAMDDATMEPSAMMHDLPESPSPSGQVRFVIVTRQRSGSHFVRSVLDAHPLVRAADELLLWKLGRENTTCYSFLGLETRSVKMKREDRVLKANLVGWGINSYPAGDERPISFVQCLQNQTFVKGCYPGDEHGRGLDDYSENIGKYKASGFIFHQNQGAKELTHVANFKKQHVRVIFLHRRNFFARAVSNKNMKVGNAASSTSPNNNSLHSVEINIKQAPIDLNHEDMDHALLVNMYKKNGIPVLYAPYETLHTQHRQFVKLFHFIGLENVTVDGSTLRDTSVDWTHTVSAESKHNPLDAISYIKNDKAVIEAFEEHSRSSAYCVCMLMRPDCEYGPVFNVNDSAGHFTLPELCPKSRIP